MTPSLFIKTWENTALNEEQGAQSWFNDLCDLIGHPKPMGALNGLTFGFEHRVETGKADAYYENHFGWEFKTNPGHLDEAMRQVLGYSMYLKTPPLLVVSAFSVIRIRTNFSGMESVQREIRIAELEQPETLDVIKRIFTEPEWFNTGKSRDDVTKETAALFEAVSNDMASSGYDHHQLAQYLNQIVFCLYAEDADLLPAGSFTSLVVNQRRDPERFRRGAQTLFSEMNCGGLFGPQTIDRFNGELFAQIPDVTLNTAALERLAEAAQKNWSNIEPSIFGTLFERALGLTEERAPLGAHYTSEGDIRRVVEPVVLDHLQREWERARTRRRPGPRRLPGSQRRDAGLPAASGGRKSPGPGLRQRKLSLRHPQGYAGLGAPRHGLPDGPRNRARPAAGKPVPDAGVGGQRIRRPTG